MTASPRIKDCPWCGDVMPDNAGAYYHEKDCRQRDVLRRIGLLEDAYKSQRAALEADLEAARYTGD